MPLQPVSTTAPVPDTAGAKRAAASAPGQDNPFTLPQDGAEAETVQAGEPRAQAPASAAPAPSAPAQAATPSDGAQTTSAALAALLALAAAATGQSAGDGEVETGPAAGDEPSEDGDGTTGTESEAGGTDSAVAALAAPPIVQASAAAVAPAVGSAGDAGAGGTEAVGGTGTDASASRIAVQPPGAQAAGEGADSGEATSPGAGEPGNAAGAAANGTSSGEPAVKVSAAPGAEFKLPEGLQNAEPIDLSALSTGATARSDPTPAHHLPEASRNAAATAQGQLAQQPATPMHVVPVEIGLRALSGMNSFEIRLDPAELGRVDVKLDISDSGEVRARLVVDRVETLHLLQRDARTLERAFEQAGLKPSDSGVDISLRDPGSQAGSHQQRQDEQTRPGQPNSIPDADDAVAGIAEAAPRRLMRLGGVDLSV